MYFKKKKNVLGKCHKLLPPKWQVHNLIYLYKKDNLFHMKIYKGSQLWSQRTKFFLQNACIRGSISAHFPQQWRCLWAPLPGRSLTEIHLLSPWLSISHLRGGAGGKVKKTQQYDAGKLVVAMPVTKAVQLYQKQSL